MDRSPVDFFAEVEEGFIPVYIVGEQDPSISYVGPSGAILHSMFS